MRRYSPPYYSPPRRGYGGRGRNPPRRGYGGKEQSTGSLLVRNIPLNFRPEDLRVPFERFGPVRDVYLPKDYYMGEPRGFAFVEFVDPYDASEAQYHMNRQLLGGREITVVLAAESRKRPEDMCKRARVRTLTFLFKVTLTVSPLFFKVQTPLASCSDHASSPRKKQSSHARSPRNHSKEHNEDVNHRSHSPSYSDANRNEDVNHHDNRPPHDAEGSQSHWRSPRHSSASLPGSRSRSADLSPRRSSE
ncbi:serine/arginine-rich SC35-like splicing factor SCL30 isoform X3 [Musa acuminata AAA Group]|uniref:serine/arginine-rich SC35-like splicing factor SCL30 isoform X3 n=1 Tax=Musa acuminata AAA Group TaxID=214697 RepID=UPI0031DDC292